jgi:hypothetical protein
VIFFIFGEILRRPGSRTVKMKCGGRRVSPICAFDVKWARRSIGPIDSAATST